jgi:hypothetical protein
LNRNAIWRQTGQFQPAAGVTSAKLLLFVAIVLLAGCKPANTPRAVVDRFIEAHYIAINLKSSERWCTGLALEKLHQEEALTAGQAIDDETRKPTVHYKLQQQRDGQDRVMYLFLATIDVPDGGTFDKKWMITARKEGEIWKVSNFNEYD